MLLVFTLPALIPLFRRSLIPPCCSQLMLGMEKP
jgi:hypothetical protein